MSKKLENSSKWKMSEAALTEASGLLRQLAGQRLADESVKAVLLRVQRKLSWSASRVRCVWYRDERISLREGELTELRAKARGQSGTDNELELLRQRIARLEQLLEVSDSAFHGPQLLAMRTEFRRMDGENRTSD